MWLKDIFAREFGFSDVQSNYSRVYAWMANQLGHMTLGMATAFFFIWIVETTYSFTDDILRAGDWLAAYSSACTSAAGDCTQTVLVISIGVCISGLAAYMSQRRESSKLFAFAFTVLLAVLAYGAAYGRSCAACWNFLFLTLAMIVVAFGFVAIICTGIFGAKKPVPAGLAARYHAVPPKGSRLLHGLVLVIACIGLWSLWPDAAVAKGSRTSDDPVMIFSIAAAVLFVAGACANLCKDTRFVVIAILSLIAIYLVATDGAGFGQWYQSEGLDELVILLPVAFILHSCIFQVWLAKPAEVFTSREAVTQTAVNVFVAALFTYAMAHLKEDEWRLAIAAGAASLTLWWVKEFASDLPNVHREIYDIGEKRPGGAHTGILGDCKLVEADYFADARMDARTDGLFYFAGAWIGAGVLTDIPVLTATPQAAGWSSGSEILGLLIFLAIFVGLGKNWAYRQLALDLVGANKASRLAVFHSALWLRVVDVAREQYVRPAAPVGQDGAIKDPLLVLRDFAGDIGDNAQPESRFHHLIVIGARGSGRSPLGRAIASEAALADWPTLFLQKRRLTRPKDTLKRTARYIPAPHLVNYLNDIHRKEDISANPTVPLYVNQKTGIVSRHPEGTGDGPVVIQPAASIVVIDDIDIEVLKNEAGVKKMIANLNIAKGQQTVWLIEVDDVDNVDWDQELTTKINEVTHLLCQLADESREDDCCRIGIGLARRVRPKDRSSAKPVHP